MASHLFAANKQGQRRNAADVEAGRKLLLAFGVDLGQADFGLQFPRCLGKGGRHRPAGATPRRPEVDNDRQVAAPDVAIEVGATLGVSVAKVINPFDNLAFSTDIQWDVAGAHKGRLISPSVSYSTPLSTAIFTSLSLSATHVDGNYADTYFSIDSVGSTASGLPQFDADGGWKSYGASLLGGVDLSGDARDGGWGVFGLVMYSRLTGDAKRSPVTSLRGDADQWFLAGGISYTF